MAPYDLLLRGGRVIDPANEIDGKRDVAILGGRIAAVAPEILPSAATRTIDVSDKIVLPGMIDTHGHVYQYVSGRFGLNPDLVGVESGVTAMYDQGGASCMTLPGFRKFIAEPAASRVYAFISAYVVGGLEGHYYPQLYGPSGVDVDATVAAASANRDLVRGIKAHAEIGGMSRWGMDVMRLAARIGREADLPVYIHFGQLWPVADGAPAVDPDAILPEIAALMRPGDILAHPFTRHPGGFVDRFGKVHPVVKEAIARGLKIDVGHGSHFSFAMARRVLDAGIMPDTLGADMHGYNTRMPKPPGTPASHPDPEENHPFAGNARFSLTFAMTELMALGVPLARIVPMVTTAAAKMGGLEAEIGTLGIGRVADVSVLEEMHGKFRLKDNEKTEVIADRFLRPVFCLRAGAYHEARAPILPAAEAA